LQDICPSPALPRLRAALEAHAPRLARGERQAAVAIVLRSAPAGEEVLFIRRAEHPFDPWSGHMAFPGGMVDPGDASPLAAAHRETREELGLHLGDTAALLGRLSDVAPLSLRASLAISPFVFELTATEVELTPNDEVQEPVWIPFAFLADPRQRSSFFWSRGGVPVPMPCCRWEGRVVWGLTLRMVDELVGLGAAGRSRRTGV
jgi:8-oxo-dGTP pyrophosphatase MutT (NUDIX family)